MKGIYTKKNVEMYVKNSKKNIEGYIMKEKSNREMYLKKDNNNIERCLKKNDLMGNQYTKDKMVNQFFLSILNNLAKKT